MAPMRAWQACGLLLLLTGACHKVNDLFCEGHPTDPTCHGDAPAGCTTNAQCTAPVGVCDLPSMACVQCTDADSAACTGTSPVCGDDKTCHACQAHADCDSNACLPDGSCGTDATVAYVDSAGTDNAACTKALPCSKISSALATNRAYLKLHGTLDEAVVFAGGKQATVLSDPGTMLTRSAGNGAIITVQDTGTTVAIYDLNISNAPNSSSGIGVVIPAASGTPSVTLTHVSISNNPGGGISASGGSLIMSRSTIRGNAGGGVTVGSGGTFSLVGNTFFNNGSSTSTAGGVSILTTQSTSNRLDFNSFSKNQAQDAIGTAIQCVAGTFTAKNNVMSGNGTLSNQEQTGGSCTHAYSIATPGTLPTGGTNIAQDPHFVNTTTGDLHILPGSPAIRAADPNADLTGIAAHDIDGDLRVSPADVGADQLPR